MPLVWHPTCLMTHLFDFFYIFCWTTGTPFHFWHSSCPMPICSKIFRSSTNNIRESNSNVSKHLQIFKEVACGYLGKMGYKDVPLVRVCFLSLVSPLVSKLQKIDENWKSAPGCVYGNILEKFEKFAVEYHSGSLIHLF